MVARSGAGMSFLIPRYRGERLGSVRGFPQDVSLGPTPKTCARALSYYLGFVYVTFSGLVGNSQV